MLGVFCYIKNKCFLIVNFTYIRAIDLQTITHKRGSNVRK